ncbi:unnamed protein product [Xylocopa violacea]|uniref:Odorant receptor n=1 Tax=Xylocopa violacea TaxID=135666 RepID=A0ABP1ND90_XYLVO
MSSKKKKDLSITVMSFYMKIVGFWLASDKAERSLRKFAMIYTVIALLIAIVVEARDIYFSWGDFSEFIYILCNVVDVCLVLYKILICFLHKKELLNLIQYAKTHFWHTNYDPREQMIMDSCKYTCTLLVCTFTFFIQGTIISYIVRPIAANVGKNESDRVLPFNLWLDLPVSFSPYFEIVFVIQVLSLNHVGVCYLCFDNFLCILNLHTASQFRILQYRFANLGGRNGQECYKIQKKPSYSTDKYARFKNIVEQHQALIEYCRRIEDVFTLIVLGQMLIFSLLICLNGYMILMDDAPLTKRLMFGFHIMGSMCQLLMFTYSCDCLTQESMNVANAVYGSLWPSLPMDKSGWMLRRDMTFVILRSNMPCCLTAGGFFVVSLETYTGILSTAVSYFTLLRNHVEVAVNG